MLIRFILLPSLIFMSFVAFAGIATAPAREAWALSTSDTIAVNYLTKTANASVYLHAVDGTLYRATATTSSARLLGVAETALSGGKGNPWLTAAIVGAGLTYEGYQWYRSTKTEGLEPLFACGYSGELGPLSDCIAKIQNDTATCKFSSSVEWDSFGSCTNFTTERKDYDDNGEQWTEFHVKYRFLLKHSDGSIFNDSNPKAVFRVAQWVKSFIDDKKQITDDDAESTIFSLLVGAESSRQAFSENNQPYPLDGLFTNEDLSVDPTYSPQADITTQNLPDYITKYNNNTLQTTDPSAPNYVTPAQYQYIKSQAEQAASTAPGGSTSTNPPQGMEQPITQKQYDESNAKTDEAAANQIKSTDWTGVDTASKGGDGANDALDKMAKGIDPTLPVLLVPDFPTYSSCRTIDLTWKGYSAVFPSQSQCVKMEEFKLNFGYFLYLLTAVGIIFELLRRVE